MAYICPETLDQMANTIGNCGADLVTILSKIEAAVQGSGGMYLPGILEDAEAISSAIYATREKADALAGKLHGKAEQIRQIIGG